jgi:hypothetical protein
MRNTIQLSNEIKIEIHQQNEKLRTNKICKEGQINLEKSEGLCSIVRVSISATAIFLVRFSK